MATDSKFTSAMILVFLLVNGQSLCDCIAEENESWNRFRGENGNGVIESSTVPLPWNPADVRWRVPLAGTGNGSPVLTSKYVVVQSANEDNGDQFIQLFDRKTGKQLWRKKYPSPRYAHHKFSALASSTPCLNDSGSANGAIFFAYASPKHCWVRCLNYDGDELWSRDLGSYVSAHGFGTSPVLAEDKVVLMVSQDALDLPEGVSPGASFVVALDQSSGDELWRTPLVSTRVSYGVPFIKAEKNRTLIVGATTQEGFFAIDAVDGKKVWTHGAFEKRVCSSVVVAGDLVIATEGSGGGGNKLIAVASDGSGEKKFEIDRAAPYVPTPILHKDKLFLWSDKGIVTVATIEGKVLNTQRVGGNVYSSPVLIGNRLLNSSDDGRVTILSADENLSKIGTVDLEAVIRATPAVSHDALFLRTREELICVGQ